ncbi:baseplate wedge subunit [Aeromonas phage Ah1]|uniref:Baseplate wedge subunit n=1 Tax=Aeromonas phage Ah1 TaxID=2053701 RepID=A0A2H4YEZ6_9CAUD|nr:baseplate wedge subunit [Aeromonas phage Ah1]AUE22733.1 baseplate wedge subunit [Aeromonas phage Ah1]UYD60205.1 baseplate wedge protein [Aeromonas phage avDM12-TAAL]
MSLFKNRLRMLAVDTKEYYSDISADFSRDFRDNDISVVTNVSAVQQSMAGIIGTRRGERPFDPNFGCDIHNSLFENMSEASATAIERSIYDAIGNYEPRVRIENVSVIPVYDRNEYIVTLYYRLITDLNYLYELKMGVAG